MASQVVDAITKKLDQLMTTSFASNATHMHTQHKSCSFCSSPMYHINDCLTAKIFADVSNEHAKCNILIIR